MKEIWRENQTKNEVDAGNNKKCSRHHHSSELLFILTLLDLLQLAR